MRINLKNTMRHLVAMTTIVGGLTMATTGAPVEAAEPIPDAGLPAVPVTASPVVSQRTEPLLAGVRGMNTSNDSFPNTNISVTSFAELDGVMYVGGKFTQVEVAATGARTNQRYLAAFDRDTGAWIDTFRPTLDGNVWDLHVTSDGRLIVAGQFSNVNGAANTAAIAALDPITGAVDPDWRVDLEVTGTTGRPLARAIDIDNGKLYIGGNFTRITGTDGITKNAGQMARVDVATGNADGTFLPNFDGVIFDIDATPDRIYAVGNYLYVNGAFSPGMTALEPSNGQRVTGLQPYVRTQIARSDKWYQQGILAVGDDVWQLGSQHNRQVYRKSDYELIRSWVSDPWGDGQTITHMNGVVYTGSHANGNTRLYRDAIAWPELTGATTSLPIKWMGAFDATAHEQLEWIPQVGSANGEGSWALYPDSTNCLWSGGDFNRGSYDGNTARYASGFVKFCATDTTPPVPPTTPTAAQTSDGVNLAWTGSTDDRGGQVRYEILKNDSVFASYISIETFRDPNGTATDRYFVRAMDYTGNRSATTQVFTAAANDTTAPSTPSGLVATVRADGDVDLTWTASTDNVGVAEYIVFRNGVEIARTLTTTAIAADPLEGDNYYQVRAIDAAGNESYKTPSAKVTIAGPDTSKPSTPQGLAGVVEAEGSITLTWTAATDDIGVVDYLVFRNGVIVDTVTSPSATVANPPAGTSYFQVRARDAAGNEGAKTSPTVVTIDAGDTTRPSTPSDLTGAVEEDGSITVTWTASTDDVGVAEYIVFRNGTEASRVAGTTATLLAPPEGTSWIQIRAVDAAGNESFKTPPIAVEVVGDDTTAPTTPSGLAAGVDANGDVVLTWTASTDNVGVAEYIVFRNGTEIARVLGPTATTTPSAGANFYQVRAIDAAGNTSFKTPPLRVDV